jgi:chorismate mutase
LSLKVRGVRGATTVELDIEEKIIDATEELIREMEASNQFLPEDVASVWITVTEDLRSAFPAKALRRIEGWNLVPVMCAREIPVVGSLTRCIRIMMHINTSLEQKEIQHVYLGGATTLRPDLHLTGKNN